MVVAATFATPAFAHRGGRDHGGKKAIGEILSYDGTTLTVSMTDGTTVAAPVATNVKVKVEHRGKKAHGKGHKKPSNGSVADLKAGAKVLKMKLTCGEVVKLRLRRAPAPAEPQINPAGDPLGDGEVQAPCTTDDVQLPGTTETDEDACAADEPETQPGDGSAGDGSAGDGS
ncbi:MAG TPA: hypothetical protein VG929_05525, partial [Actinomycetota bacterium]|nr:hypothetical protein [Actinomycetota bacterium]